MDELKKIKDLENDNIDPKRWAHVKNKWLHFAGKRPKIKVRKYLRLAAASLAEVDPGTDHYQKLKYHAAAEGLEGINKYLDRFKKVELSKNSQVGKPGAEYR